MLKKTITFEDLNGNQITEDFYFHLTKAELFELQTSVEGGLENHFQYILKSGDQGLLISTFKNLLAKTVGRRSEDGKRFIKSDDISLEFIQTDAYSVVFMEFMNNPRSVVEFFTSVVSRDIGEKIDVNTVLAQAEEINPSVVQEGSVVDNRPAWERENREPTRRELLSMPQEQLVALMQERTRISDI